MYYALLPILDILLTFDFLLKPPQPATWLFLTLGVVHNATIYSMKYLW